MLRTFETAQPYVMLYPTNIETKLGFDKIRELLTAECLGPLGQKFVSKIKFTTKPDHIKKMLVQTDEFLQILQADSAFPSQNYLDVSELLKRAEIPGAILYEEDFFDLKLSLVTLQQIFHYFNQRPTEKYPELRVLMHTAVPEHTNNGWENLTKDIAKVIDDRGQVTDHASDELYAIRRKLKIEQGNIERTLRRIYQTAKNSGWVGEDMSLAVRNGRLVVPILAEHKKKMRGFVHDETSTGQIAFIEPAEVLEANNEIRELEIKERREILRILEALTTRIRPEIPALEKSYTFLGLIDFIRAKAKFALLTGGTLPEISKEQYINWLNARHPLLYLAHKKQGKPIVPLQITLDENSKILVVSGPNAGGKSVLLKTVGLLQYMLQCGLLPPLSPDSKMGIFASLFIDIGDEQSIENDLSTYSSHLTNMRHFLQYADAETLFLIDEFGTGTEPSLGGALAEAILEILLLKKAFGIVNTHYTNLKVFADKHKGMINGAMRFDAEKLLPLFELEIGKPGNSFAFEVAQKIGLPTLVIKNAKRKLGQNQLNFEKLLKELDIEKKAFAEQNLALKKEIAELKLRTEQYGALKTFLEEDKRRILATAKEEAKKIVKDANKTIENTIRQIKENNAEKEASRLAREQVKAFVEKELTPETPPKIKKPQPTGMQTQITVGDYVRIKGQETIAQVVKTNGQEVEIILGELKSNVKLNRLEKISKKDIKTLQKTPVKSMKGVNLNEKMEDFSFNLDLRGKRGDEAIIAVDNLLDDALLLGYPQLRIVHGKGDGILKVLVRNHLKQYKQIAKIYDEHPDRGGAGVTLVDLK